MNTIETREQGAKLGSGIEPGENRIAKALDDVLDQ
jgi:hypothetical protein